MTSKFQMKKQISLLNNLIIIITTRLLYFLIPEKIYFQEMLYNQEKEIFNLEKTIVENKREFIKKKIIH